jgi:hypothetical protein
MKTAASRRDAIAKAAREWIEAHTADPTSDEAHFDIALESHLLTNGVLTDDDILYGIWFDNPETLMLRVNGSTIIEIDVESGNYMSGEADE